MSVPLSDLLGKPYTALPIPDERTAAYRKLQAATNAMIGRVKEFGDALEAVYSRPQDKEARERLGEFRDGSGRYGVDSYLLASGRASLDGTLCYAEEAEARLTSECELDDCFARATHDLLDARTRLGEREHSLMPYEVCGDHAATVVSAAPAVPSC